MSDDLAAAFERLYNSTLGEYGYADTGLQADLALIRGKMNAKTLLAAQFLSEAGTERAAREAAEREVERLRIGCCHICWCSGFTPVEQEDECVRQHPHTGSHFRCETCWLKAQWQAERDYATRALKRAAWVYSTVDRLPERLVTQAEYDALCAAREAAERDRDQMAEMAEGCNAVAMQEARDREAAEAERDRLREALRKWHRYVKAHGVERDIAWEEWLADASLLAPRDGGGA